MIKWTALIILFQTVAATISGLEYHSDEFSWQVFKQLAAALPENVATAPSFIQEIFHCLLNVTSAPESDIKALSNELSLAINVTNNDSVSKKFSLHQERLRNQTALNVITLATAVGSGQLSRKFNETMNHCHIYKIGLEPASGAEMTTALNNYVNSISNGSISTVLGESDHLITTWNLQFLNFIKLNAPWKYKFELINTCPFYVNKSVNYSVNYMGVEGLFRHSYDTKYAVQAVEVPFRNDSPFSCLLLIPLKGSLAKMIQNFDQYRFKQIYKRLQFGKTSIVLPRAYVQTSHQSKEMLNRMGLEILFTKDVFQIYDAPSPPVHLTELTQKVLIGFQPGGATFAKKQLDHALGSEFTANEPFVFVIFDHRTIVPAVIGRLTVPPPEAKGSTQGASRMCQNAPVWTKNVRW